MNTRAQVIKYILSSYEDGTPIHQKDLCNELGVSRALMSYYFTGWVSKGIMIKSGHKFYVRSYSLLSMEALDNLPDKEYNDTKEMQQKLDLYLATAVRSKLNTAHALISANPRGGDLLQEAMLVAIDDIVKTLKTYKEHIRIHRMPREDYKQILEKHNVEDLYTASKVIKDIYTFNEFCDWLIDSRGIRPL